MPSRGCWSWTCTGYRGTAGQGHEGLGREATGPGGGARLLAEGPPAWAAHPEEAAPAHSNQQQKDEEGNREMRAQQPQSPRQRGHGPRGSRDPKALGRGSGSKDGGSGLRPVPPAAALEELSTRSQRGDTAADGKQQQTRTSTSAPWPELRPASAQKPVPREGPARTTEDSPAGSERAGCRARGVDGSSGAESPGLLCSLHCRCVDPEVALGPWKGMTEQDGKGPMSLAEGADRVGPQPEGEAWEAAARWL